MVAITATTPAMAVERLLSGGVGGSCCSGTASPRSCGAKRNAHIEQLLPNGTVRTWPDHALHRPDRSPRPSARLFKRFLPGGWPWPGAFGSLERARFAAKGVVGKRPSAPCIAGTAACARPAALPKTATLASSRHRIVPKQMDRGCSDICLPLHAALHRCKTVQASKPCKKRKKARSLAQL